MCVMAGKPSTNKANIWLYFDLNLCEKLGVKFKEINDFEFVFLRKKSQEVFENMYKLRKGVYI